MEIKKITNKDKSFYQLLGPYLARRKVEREIGYKIYDDDGKTWLVAIELKKIVGFCYVWEKSKNKFQIGSFYVVEKYRQKGTFKKLLGTATKGIQGTVTITTNNAHIKSVLTLEGYTKGRARGSFIDFMKEFIK